MCLPLSADSPVSVTVGIDESTVWEAFRSIVYDTLTIMIIAMLFMYAHFFVETAFPDRTITWIIAFICAAGAVMSMVGDLAASAIKRNHNIKDYGKLIPGHGGIMDRFDSSSA